MLPETEFPQTIHIWTDGSKQIDNKMGYAAIIINKCTDNISRKSHRIEGPPSSTRPELYAIMAGILNCPTNAKITIFTDSQNAMLGGPLTIFVQGSERRNRKFRSLCDFWNPSNQKHQ